jgi:coenzyme F420 biosynthesis associated uncharacterized protein
MISGNVGRTLALGFASAVAAALVFEATRPLGGRDSLLDWDHVRDLAHQRRAADRPIPPERLELLAAEYNRLAAEVMDPLLQTVGSLPPGVAMAPFQALDRSGWLDLNIGILRQATAPLMEATVFPRSRLTIAGKAGAERYTALLLAFLSQRVLGQFDPQLLGREPVQQSLYLVEPNVEAWEAREGLNAADLRRWLILHELAHAWQFAAHPWLRDHLNQKLERLIELAAGSRGAPSWRRLLNVTVGAPEPWRIMRDLQAAMSLVEGYGNLVMNQVGRRILPSYEDLEAAYQARSGSRSPLELLFWRVTGLELKMEQYRVGEAFARHIHDVYGMAVLNRAWDGPDALPRPSELRDPQRWYRRVVGRGGPIAQPAF